VIRVVVDTNVLISALLTAGGSPDQVLVAIRNRRLVPYVSPDLLAEYGEVVMACPIFCTSEIVSVAQLPS
jgi:putative PIN family toxin of toxin-antitoxin system